MANNKLVNGDVLQALITELEKRSIGSLESTGSAITIKDLAGNTKNTIPSFTGATDSENGTSGLVPIPTAGKQNKFLCADATWKDAGGLPVGHEFFTTNPNIPAGCIPLLGGEYSRTAYADLWAWVQTQQGYLIEESAWQARATANSGNVPFYSKGDGTTTFRVPSLKCWVKGANGIEEVGSYLSAGLPNIEAFYDDDIGYARADRAGWHGAVYLGNLDTSRISAAAPSDGLKYCHTWKFDASKSNPVYGKSNTVQPPSIVGMWLVKAYGTVTNVGSTDVAAIAQGLTRVENKLNEAAIVGTVIPYAGTSLPTGYLPCNGAAISRETYASLFAVIGETYGSGDGSTTFNLPNLTDKFIQGSDTAGTVKSAGLPNISGNFEVLFHGHATWAEGEASDAFKVTKGKSSKEISFHDLGSTQGVGFNFNASNSNSIYGASSTVQPPALTMRYIIKY